MQHDANQPQKNQIHHGDRVLVKVLHDMELRKPRYYFVLSGLGVSMVGTAIGLTLFQLLYGNLQFGSTFLAVLFALVGAFVAFVGIILHLLSCALYQLEKREFG